MAFAVVAALLFRILPAWNTVFTPWGVGFQEPDAWFHIRNVHNLLAHFPHHSGFDPYALFPRGENIVTGPFWDYTVGWTAWIIGLGSPSSVLIDEVGAWLPAVLGALLPVLVFFLARRLFGQSAALWSALWVAIIPGTFLWVSHLGMADHHAAEVFASLLALVLLCEACENEGRRRWLFAVFSGTALAAYLDIQVTGIFAPVLFTIAALASPGLADVCAAAIASCAVFLLNASGIAPWLQYRWLALGGTFAVTAALAFLNREGLRRKWPFTRIAGTGIVIALIGAGVAALAEPALLQSLLAQVRAYQPGQPGSELTSTVKELQPLWSSAPGGFGAFFAQFGTSWVFAVPAFGIAVVMAFRTRRPALALFVVWGVGMILGVVSHVRMGAYTGIVVAVLAGFSSAWLVERIPAAAPRLQVFTSAILVVICAGISLPAGIAQTGHSGVDEDWRKALNFLRWSTPEPLRTPEAWYRYWLQMPPGHIYRFPPTAYGVIAPWDRGWWISGIAHRIPSANGGESGATETSRFLTETFPADAQREMQELGGRYVAIGAGVISVELPGIVSNARRRIDDFSRQFYLSNPNGAPVPVRLYLPDFYRSMAARLYIFNAHRVDTSEKGVQVFLTSFVDSREIIGSVLRFTNEAEAQDWMKKNSNISAVLASADPTRSCVDLEELSWLQPAFVSRQETIALGRQPVAVKVFALRP